MNQVEQYMELHRACQTLMNENEQLKARIKMLEDALRSIKECDFLKQEEITVMFNLMDIAAKALTSPTEAISSLETKQ
jgi:hypothetical protein